MCLGKIGLCFEPGCCGGACQLWARHTQGGLSISKIIIVDDDYAQELLAENLQFRGHDVTRMRSVKEALEGIDLIASSDLLILDIIMEYGEDVVQPSVSGNRVAGMTIYRSIRQHKPDLPILVYSATADNDIRDIIRNDKNTTFVSKWSTPTMNELADIIAVRLGVAGVRPGPTAFIVHGHNDLAKLDLKNYLQNVLGLPEPIILHEKPDFGRTIIEKFEDFAYTSNLAFILLTPDDHLYLDVDHKAEEMHRARQNVILEMGFFLGQLGRKTGRVFLLHSGLLDLPNDISGVIYIDISAGIESAGERIRRELNHVLTSRD